MPALPRECRSRMCPGNARPVVDAISCPLTEVMTQTTLATAADVSPLRFEALPRPDRTSSWSGGSSSVKQQMGDSLLILGHHYQQDEVIRFADLRGDSFKLSQLAADSRACRAIVFCGVHFMAETADVLSRDEVEVYLPDLAAGCSMADMADLESVEAAWEDLGEIIDTNDITPVTYINSSAELKAFCGRHGGIVCTSSNARAVLEWSFARRSRVLFFPDQHLGRNTARAMGIPLEPDGRLGPARTAGRKHRSGDRRQPGLALERPLLGPPDVQARARQAIPAAGFPTARSWSIPNA